MRKLVAFVGFALSCAGARPQAAPPVPPPNAAPVSHAPRQESVTPPSAQDGTQDNTIDWCKQAYPWSGGPLTTVSLGKDCVATYQEARAGVGGETAAWTWRIQGVRQDPEQKVALVTLEMRQSIGPATATYRRTYRFFREGRNIALVGADAVVRMDDPAGGGRAP